MVTGPPYHFQKMKVNETAFICIFCCGGHFSMRKCIVFRDKFDVLCPQRAKRCNVLGSAVLLISLHSEIKKHICEHYVTWTNIEFWQWSGIYWHSLFNFFKMKTTLFLYNSGNQHSADLSFHVMCYRCCLQLSQLLHMLFGWTTWHLPFDTTTCNASCF